jgi:MerR family copper efflux transcriptional regulator
MNIGEASQATGVSAKMIRYYEETGLIRPAQRSQSGYRVYAGNDIQTLRFVRRARDLGFTVRQIETLLQLWRDRSRASSDVKRIATDHIADLQKKMRDLQEMVTVLTHLAQNCHGDSRPDCPILTSLADDGAAEAAPTRKSPRPGRGFGKKPGTRR